MSSFSLSIACFCWMMTPSCVSSVATQVCSSVAKMAVVVSCHCLLTILSRSNLRNVLSFAIVRWTQIVKRSLLSRWKTDGDPFLAPGAGDRGADATAAAGGDADLPAAVRCDVRSAVVLLVAARCVEVALGAGARFAARSLRSSYDSARFFSSSVAKLSHCTRSSCSSDSCRATVLDSVSICWSVCDCHSTNQGGGPLASAIKSSRERGTLRALRARPVCSAHHDSAQRRSLR